MKNLTAFDYALFGSAALAFSVCYPYLYIHTGIQGVLGVTAVSIFFGVCHFLVIRNCYKKKKSK